MIRRVILFWLVGVLGVASAWAGSESRRLGEEEIVKWLNEFLADHTERGVEAFTERIDAQRLLARSMKVSGLDKERRRHETLVRQILGELRSQFDGMKDLQLGRRMNEGGHWSVMAYFSDPAGLFIFRRLRIEGSEGGKARITDWADMPCDVECSEVMAAQVLVQTMTPPEKVPERLRAELAFYHENPRRYVGAAMAAGLQNGDSLATELMNLPPEARFGVLAREWRGILLMLYPPDFFYVEQRLQVGSAERDPLRGLLMYRAGVRAKNPEMALRGLELLSAQLEQDLHIRMEKCALLMLAGRVEEAARVAAEAAELYPTFYNPHIHRLAALRIAGETEAGEAVEADVGLMLGAEVKEMVVRHAADLVVDMKRQRKEMMDTQAAISRREVWAAGSEATAGFGAEPIRLDLEHAPLFPSHY